MIHLKNGVPLRGLYNCFMGHLPSFLEESAWSGSSSQKTQQVTPTTPSLIKSFFSFFLFLFPSGLWYLSNCPVKSSLCQGTIICPCSQGQQQRNWCLEESIAGVGHTARWWKTRLCSGDTRSGLQGRATLVTTGENWDIQASPAFSQWSTVVQSTRLLEKAGAGS